MLRLLCVTAHPDDEAGGFGGSLRLYADRGVQTSVVCLTDGQAASNRGDAKSGDQLGRIRREEFERSCTLLGVHQREIAHWQDKHLSLERTESIAEFLVQRIREIKPHVMLTFGTEGAVTAHPDHTMASLFATAAFHWAGRKERYPEQLERGLAPWRVQKLYYETSDAPMPGRPATSPAPWTAIIDIGEKNMRVKRDAFAAHTTQNPILPLFDERLQQRGPRELYHLAACVHPMSAVAETDLFENVQESYGGA